MRILKINLNNLRESIDAISEAVETIKMAAHCLSD